jgi:hypothetical protein
MKKIIFILFPGHCENKYDWDFDFDDHKKSYFITTLKKLGQIFFVDFPWNNLLYYKKWQRSKFFTKDIDFTYNDLDVNIFCKKIFDQIKFDNDSKFILIGHSLGCRFAYTFGQLFHSKCLFSIFLEPTLYSNIKIKCNELDIYRLKNDIISTNENDGTIAEIMYLIGCKIIDSSNKCYIKSKIKTFVFSDVSRNNEMLNLQKENESNIFNFILFENKNHYPHYYSDSREIILNTIITEISH